MFPNDTAIAFTHVLMTWPIDKICIYRVCVRDIRANSFSIQCYHLK